MSQSRPAHAQKAKIVEEFVTRIKESQGIAIAEYKNLTVAQMTEFRREALKQNIIVKVYKDSLVCRAAKEAGLEELNPFLTQQNIYVFSEDSVSASKLVANFAKKNPDMILKAGIFEGKVMDTKAITEIATLPSKEELYSMFASSLIYPLRQFMLLTKAIAEQKTA